MSARLVTAVLCLAVAGTGRSGGQEMLRSYVVDQERSSLFLVTHRAGLLSFFGHEHAIVPGEWRAELCLAEPIPRSAHGNVVIQSRSLAIDTDFRPRTCRARQRARRGRRLGDPGEDAGCRTPRCTGVPRDCAQDRFGRLGRGRQPGRVRSIHAPRHHSGCLGAHANRVAE